MNTQKVLSALCGSLRECIARGATELDADLEELIITRSGESSFIIHIQFCNDKAGLMFLRLPLDTKGPEPKIDESLN